MVVLRVKPMQRAIVCDPVFLAVIPNALAISVVDHGTGAAFCDGFW
jgi:hypothetical protein